MNTPSCDRPPVADKKLKHPAREWITKNLSTSFVEADRHVADNVDLVHLHFMNRAYDMQGHPAHPTPQPPQLGSVSKRIK